MKQWKNIERLGVCLLCLAMLFLVGCGKSTPPQAPEPPIVVEKPEEPREPVLPEPQAEPQKEEPEEPIPLTVETREDFYRLFHELDRDSMEEFLNSTSDAEAGETDWANFKVKFSQEGSDQPDIFTTAGDQVLAIDVPNRILLLQVTGQDYHGALAVAKDPSRLLVAPSEQLGESGQCAGDIALAHNGVLAMNASSFVDEDGKGDGGSLLGYAMHSGAAVHTTPGGPGFQRLELHGDNTVHILPAGEPVGEDTTDAMEFVPAILADGEVQEAVSAYDGIHPRACIGQTQQGEILMLVIEGRLPGRSLGTTLENCGEILLTYGADRAMNLDGGTSAILWYDGEYVTQCSNRDLPSGRLLPNAFVYSAGTVQ